MKLLLSFAFCLFGWISICQKDTLIPVELNEKWGFVNQKGDTVIPLMYTWADNFHEGFARVYLGGHIRSDMGPFPEGGKYGFIDSTGQALTEFKYHHAKSFNNGYAVIMTELEDGFWENAINLQGNEIVPDGYQLTEYKPFGQEPHPHLALVLIPNKVSYFKHLSFVNDSIKKAKKKCSECTGVLRLRTEHAMGVVDSSGVILIEPNYRMIQFVENHELVLMTEGVGLNKLVGMSNLKGEVLIKPEYVEIGDFHNGYSILKNRFGLNGLIDTTGRIVLPCAYESIRFLDDGIECSSIPLNEMDLEKRIETYIVMDYLLQEQVEIYQNEVYLKPYVRKEMHKTHFFPWTKLIKRMK